MRGLFAMLVLLVLTLSACTYLTVPVMASQGDSAEHCMEPAPLASDVYLTPLDPALLPAELPDLADAGALAPVLDESPRDELVSEPASRLMPSPVDLPTWSRSTAQTPAPIGRELAGHRPPVVVYRDTRMLLLG